MKKLIALSLFAGGMAFAQSGLMGGTSGIHQHNAYTLGKGGFELGTGGDVAFDNWSMARYGVLNKGAFPMALHEDAGSLAGNFHAAMGVANRIDIGVALPLNYDHANARNVLPLGEGDIWKASRGDVDLWVKYNFFGDEKQVFALAFLMDVYLPTGDKSVGLRPRHVWYLNDEGGQTHPYTSNDLNIGGTLVMSVNLANMGFPVLWNSHIGIVYADEGTSAIVYGTGINAMPLTWMDVFVEYSGEFMVEDGYYPRDPWDTPMQITPGLRFHLPWNIDFSAGLDVAVRALRNFTFADSKELDGVEQYQIHYYDKHGQKVRYGYVPTPNYAGTANLTWRFGGKTVKDEDKDGVLDANDKCPHTPEVARVDSVGCPIDSDKDGLIDGLDKCPGTPEGATIDTLGCPMDSDNDGVYDGVDKCPNTPAGVLVDATGCPLDSDKDGVLDANDKCPNTPEGAPVDSTGCVADEDKDGIADALDKCPKTPLGAAVDSVGCAIDSDKDGIPDVMDHCPNTMPGAIVDSTGCSADSDKDGVPDGLDKCPNTPAGQEVDNTGCLRDFDKDGVPDAMDKCPNTPAGVTVDSSGCSLDMDKDGVPDALDVCPNTPSGASVDSTGCPMDTDADGVPDYLDKCPNTLPGVKIDAKGCPVNKKEDLEQLKKGIEFKLNSATLTKKSYGTLDDIIKLMKKIPSANLEVQGHTDDTGDRDYNMKLSDDRAKAVVDYFVQQGIEPERVRGVGYGPDKPIADNKKKAGRAKNRRVELVPFHQ
ncbi:MAG: OmpA family protein [Fibrobacter sp.]|nr:OmpA family protein [Fibrobacter sp.]